MSEDKTIVKESVSESDKLKPEERQSFENQAKEYQRKYQELSDKFETVTSELDELKEKVNLSRGDRDRIETLEDRKQAILDEKASIRSNPRARGWLEVTQEISSEVSTKAVEDAIYDYDYRQAIKNVKNTARSLKVDPKKFEDEIFAILKGGRWEVNEKGKRIMPTERVELAIEEYHNLASLREKANKGEEVEKQFAERGNRSFERQPTKKEDLEKAKETGSFKDILSKVAGRQAEIQEGRAKYG